MIQIPRIRIRHTVRPQQRLATMTTPTTTTKHNDKQPQRQPTYFCRVTRQQAIFNKFPTRRHASVILLSHQWRSDANCDACAPLQKNDTDNAPRPDAVTRLMRREKKLRVPSSGHQQLGRVVFVCKILLPGGIVPISQSSGQLLHTVLQVVDKRPAVRRQRVFLWCFNNLFTAPWIQMSWIRICRKKKKKAKCQYRRFQRITIWDNAQRSKKVAPAVLTLNIIASRIAEPRPPRAKLIGSESNFRVGSSSYFLTKKQLLLKQFLPI